MSSQTLKFAAAVVALLMPAGANAAGAAAILSLSDMSGSAGGSTTVTGTSAPKVVMPHGSGSGAMAIQRNSNPTPAVNNFVAPPPHVSTPAAPRANVTKH